MATSTSKDLPLTAEAARLLDSEVLAQAMLAAAPFDDEADWAEYLDLLETSACVGTADRGRTRPLA
jgi:hypothetical protein